MDGTAQHDQSHVFTHPPRDIPLDFFSRHVEPNIDVGGAWEEVWVGDMARNWCWAWFGGTADG